MKITLIKPRIGKYRNYEYIDEGRMEPLQLAVLAGITPKDCEIVCYDDSFSSNIEKAAIMRLINCGIF